MKPKEILRLETYDNMAQHFTYILRCADGSLYTGYTTDVHRRLAEHNGKGSGKGAKATRMKRPVALVYFECHSSKQAAMSREWHIKHYSKAVKEKLIRDNQMMKIILASGSPRRKELLLQAGIDFEVITSDIDEVCEATEPGQVVMELSMQKALAVAEKCPGQVVLGADTVVAIDGNILGKPADEAEAFNMLSLLSGKKHMVFTGVTIIDKSSQAHVFFESTLVEMYELTEEEIRAYIATGEPMDKAGAYGIQGKGATLIKGIEGDYNNVVGLPLARVYRALKKYI